MLQRAFSVLFWGFLVLSSVLLFPVALVLWAVTKPFDRRTRALHQFTCFWASLYTWLNPWWPVRVTGREDIPAEPCVLVANHLSLLDILVLFRLFTPFVWVSKAENFKVPFIGWNMHLNGYIPLRRGDRASVLVMLEKCERALRGGTPVMMFPEGTRSQDGVLRPFKAGAFDLALRVGVPVVPVVVTGTGTALPKRGFVLRGRHEIGVQVLAPVRPRPDETPEELADRVRAIFSERVPA
ncbi:MAG: 1-acyl-sn-glycerol-3-phosphate acyltransferase [Frankiales bacterium]|nr:1-acyl-sn-glycerol-3-phosphate acyltransferase [Frankiales bacterium]